MERLLIQTTDLGSFENQDHYFQSQSLEGTQVYNVKGLRVYLNKLLLFYFHLSFPFHLPILMTCHSLKRKLTARIEEQVSEGVEEG